MLEYFHRLFDNSSTPILFCSEEGTVLAKNLIAKKHIKSPRCKYNIYKYIENPGITDYISLVEQKIVIIKNSESHYNKALIVETEIMDTKCTLWIFLSYIQFFDYSFIIESIEKYPRHLIWDSDYIIKRLSENSDNYISLYTRFDRVANNLYNIMVNILNTISFSGNEINTINQILKKYISSIFSKFGCRFNFFVNDVAGDKTLYCPDFCYFASSYIQILLFALKSSAKCEAGLCFTITETELFAELSFTRSDPEFIVDFSGDFELLACTYPNEFFNILMFNFLAKKFNWEASYSVLDTEKNNFRIYTSVPLKNKIPHQVKQTSSVEKEFQNRYIEYSIETMLNIL